MRINDYVRNEVFEIILYVSIILGSFLIGTIGGFSLRGFEESFRGAIEVQTYLGTGLVYLFLLPVALGLIIFPIVSLLILRKGEHPATQTPKRWYQHLFSVSYVHAPENGILHSLIKSPRARKYIKSFRVIFFISILLFGLIAIIQISNPTLNVFGTPNRLQQVTTISNLAFGSLIPSVTENGNILFIYFLLLGAVSYFTSRMRDRGVSLLMFFLIAFLLCILMGAMWASYHLIVYGNNEANLFATFIFGFIGTLLTLVTGSSVPFLIWHIFNNGAIILRDLFSASIIPLFIAVWALIFVIYVSAEVLLRKT